MIRWPWRRHASPEWARQVVAGIPREDLPNHVLTFADQWASTKNPRLREMHRQKCIAACARLEVELGGRRTI